MSDLVTDEEKSRVRAACAHAVLSDTVMLVTAITLVKKQDVVSIAKGGEPSDPLAWIWLKAHLGGS